MEVVDIRRRMYKTKLLDKSRDLNISDTESDDGHLIKVADLRNCGEENMPKVIEHTLTQTWVSTSVVDLRQGGHWSWRMRANLELYWAHRFSVGSFWGSIRKWHAFTRQNSAWYHLLIGLNSFSVPRVPSRHKWWPACLILRGSELWITLPLPLPFLFLLTGIRITTTFTCGVWLPFYIPQARIANYITFTFCLFYSPKIKIAIICGSLVLLSNQFLTISFAEGGYEKPDQPWFEKWAKISSGPAYAKLLHKIWLPQQCSPQPLPPSLLPCCDCGYVQHCWFLFFNGILGVRMIDELTLVLH